MPQLSWTHYYQLVDIDDSKKRAFYENKAVQNFWGVRELGSEIKSQLYENTPKKEIEKVFQTKLPAIEPYEAFKDAYNFNFLGLDELHNEKELEDKIILHLEKMLYEFGEDFAILGRQVPIRIDNEPTILIWFYTIAASIVRFWLIWIFLSPGTRSNYPAKPKSRKPSNTFNLHLRPHREPLFRK